MDNSEAKRLAMEAADEIDGLLAHRLPHSVYLENTPARQEIAAVILKLFSRGRSEMIKCRLCGKLGSELSGVVLTRVNEKGVEGIWECRPICGAQLPADEALLAAIDGRFEQQVSEDESGVATR